MTKTEEFLRLYWFVEAGSPAKAMQICEKRMEEAAHAGEFVAEEYE